MLLAPRALAAMRPSTRADILAAAAASAAAFAAAPFLVPAVADRYAVTLASASLIATAQLAGFVVASLVAGWRLTPSSRLLRRSSLVAAAGHLGAASTPWFPPLVAVSAVTGGAIGIVVWIGWREVFGDERRVGDVAVVDPAMAALGAPLAALLASAAGPGAVYVALAGTAALPLALSLRDGDFTRPASRSRSRAHRTPAAWAILLALGILTTGGSSVLIFAAAIGTDRVGLDPLVVSLAFSANALLGVPAARYRGVRRHCGLWFLVPAAGAIVVTSTSSGPLFWLTIAIWGFAFWAGLPGALVLLASRSRHSGQHAGSAQSVMATGRALGPLVGAAFVRDGALGALGLTAAAFITVAALMLTAIEARGTGARGTAR